MALSFEAQSQELNKMKHEDERSMSVSPPMSSNPSLFSGLLPPTMNMLSPHLFGNAAAYMACIPQLRANLAAAGLFSQHNPLFPAWGAPPSSNSPPHSPISPATAYKKLNNNHIVSTTSEMMMSKKQKTTRKPFAKKETNTISVKKDLLSPSSDVSIDMMPGLISPPNSGSSPNSTGSIDMPSVASTTKDPSREKVFTCKICNRSFGYKHVLQNHERTHTGEKPFECPECHKRFTRDHHLKTHMRLHTGEKPYSCSHCDRQFVQVANLRRHLRVHTGERPYTCDICEARFSDSNQLKAHSLIHNGEKPFSCDRCHSRFRRRHHFLHHKCDMPPLMTPTLASPLFDMKCELSDESLDLTKTVTPKPYLPPTLLDMPKIRLPQIMHVTSMMPEQTEPEDLSMRSPRSPLTVEEMDELDDAATLYRKQRQKILQVHGATE